MPTIVDVELPTGGYPILIGADALSESRRLLADVIGDGRACIVADETVWDLHGGALTAVSGELPVIGVAPGEASKSFAQFERVAEALLAKGLGRDGTVIAFGGGVVGDLAGFCAATLNRGCRLVQVPTTLLSQVDSSVGGKTAINSVSGKNLVGAFHQPELVVIDTAFLATLPPRELKSGYAEVVKYGLIGDAAFFAKLEDERRAILDLDPAALTSAIETSCRHKAKVVAADEREKGQRALLNLGHTFGHALETAAGYDGGLLHGEAVACGMAMAFRYSVARGHCSDEDAARVTAHLATVGLPTRPSEIAGLKTTPADQRRLMSQDKKVEGGQLRLVLANGIGDAFLARDVDADHLLAFLEQEFRT